MFKAIFWDNDGVLVDTEKFYYLANKKLLSRYEIELTEELFRDLYLTRSTGAWHLIPNVNLGSLDISNLRNERNAMYIEMLQTGDFKIPGVEQTLKLLKARYTMAVVTSSLRKHFEIIHRRTNYLRFFNFVLTREDYNKSKPEPEPYLTALELLAIDPEYVVVVEDSERGIIAAKRAGLTCWAVPNRLSTHGDFSQADKVLSNIGEVAQLLLDDSMDTSLSAEKTS
jgi:HAD superfamily hydrolase (TIGR01509 family)